MFNPVTTYLSISIYRSIYLNIDIDVGPLFRSSAPIALTEAETEYVVTCIKHVFKHHIVLEYQVLNTVQDQMLVNVGVNLELMLDEAESSIYTIECYVRATQVKYSDKESTYVCLKHMENTAFPLVTIANELTFTVIEGVSAGKAPSTSACESGYKEEYPMEDVEFTGADCMAKVQVPDFRSAWEHLGDEYEVREQYALRFSSLVEGYIIYLSI
jgi:coatomer protein complex subunit gamma